MAQRKALIRYYFHTDPDEDFGNFAKQWAQLYFALKFDGKIKEVEVKKG